MASLLNKYIYETYKGLIKTLDNEPIDGALKPLSDGEGNELPIKVSDTDVEVGFLTSKNLFIEEYGEVIDQNGNWTGPTQGLAGTSGTSGTNGAAGTSGTSGVNGSSGQTGSAGTSGTSGAQGISGTSGTSGINGVSGTSGTSGQNGTSGTSGQNGVSGTSGTSGQDGTSGTSGQDGFSGTGGTSGTSGISQPGTPGTSGTSGTSGVSNDGTSGTSGVNGISSGQVYYFNQSQNSDVSPYKVLATSPNGPQVITPTNLTSNQQNALVSQFITPQLGFGIIPGGNQRFHLHFLKPAANDEIEAYVTIQLADSAGTPIGPVLQSGLDLIGWVDASTPSEVTLDLTLSNTFIDPTSRMIVKIYLNNNDSTTHTVNWYTEGQQYYSFVVTTVASVSGTSGTSGVNGTSGTSGTTPVGGITTSGPNTIANIWSGTQAEYAALGTYSATTLYFIE